MEPVAHSYLRRLEPEAYCGFAVVHWIHTIRNRKTGWLNADFHLEFRELLLHASATRRFLCPAYCLMPDHIHLVWMGLELDTDLRLANRWLRRELNAVLERRGVQLQKQSYDRVLRENERKRSAFEDLVSYVLENPERASLDPGKSFSGMLVPGYPKLRDSLRKRPEDWEMFWKVYYRLREDA